jgi:hypothetical protein
MSIYNFPDQTISESAKNEAWHKQHVLGYMRYAGSKHYSAKKKEISKLYHAYSASLDDEDKKKIEATVTQRCGNNFGPEYVVYPLIESKIDKMVGDYRKRPVKRKLLVNNQDAVIKKFDDKLNMLAESLLRKENETMADSLGFAPESPNPEMEIPEDVEEFFAKDYRTLSEENGEDILKQILVVRKEKEKLYDALKHYLISGFVWGLAEEKDGHPSIFIPHILDCEWDYNPNETVQRDPQYFIYDRFMPINDIFNTFTLSEKQKNQTRSYTANNSLWYLNDSQYGLRPRVVSMYWKSRKRIKFKSFVNKEGTEEFKILSDDYKERNRDKIEYLDIEDVRHVTMIGPDIVLSWGSLENQMKTAGDEKKRFIPAVGLVDYGGMGREEIRSLAKKLLYLQNFASEILYEIRLSMRQVDGNVLVWDLSNSPKEWLKDGPDAAFEKMNFFLKRDRVQIINSKDKRSNPYASSINVSQKGRLQELMNLMALIENMADTITGISTKEQNPYQKATVAEIGLENTTSRTEEYFGLFDTFTDILNERVLLKSKSVYKKGEVFTYFAGDTQMKFLEISPDFMYDDLGIYVTDNRKDYEDKKLLNDVAAKLFGNAQSPELMLDLIRVIKSDNVSEAEGIVQKGINALKALKAENDKMMAQIEENKTQAQLESEKIKAAQSDKVLQNNIDVANIYAENNADGIRVKEDNNNLRKMADIEAKLMELQAKQNEK